jgi:hypothetical protein
MGSDPNSPNFLFYQEGVPMNRFAYRVYYQYNGPSHSDPLRSPKDSDEIGEALRYFPNELCHYLSDQDATVSHEQTKNKPNSIIVFVATVLEEAKTDDAVKLCLNGLDLFGEKLKQV